MSLRNETWAENYSSTLVSRDREMADSPETILPQSTENAKKLLVHLQARETLDTSSTCIFYKDCLALAKTDLEESNQGVHVLFSRDAHVYFFNEGESCWRERGFSRLQILRDNTKYHIFMADHVSIFVAHEVTPAMDLKPNAGSDRSWVWFTLADHSDSQVVPRELAAEFRSVEDSFEFKKVFDESRDACGVPHEGHVHAVAASFESNIHNLPSHITSVKPDFGLWRICNGCKVENSIENTSCLVCGESLTGDIPLRPVKKPQVTIKSSSPTHKFKKPVPTPKHLVVKKAAIKLERFTPVTHWWKCMVCEVENNMENQCCFVCSTPKPTLTCSPEINEMLDEISKK